MGMFDEKLISYNSFEARYSKSRDGEGTIRFYALKNAFRTLILW